MNRRTFLRSLVAAPATSFLGRAKTEQRSRTTVMDAAISGTRFYDAPARINQLTIGQSLVLRPEPNNQHDENAVEIYTEGGLKLGYAPRSSARRCSTLLYDVEGLKAELTEIALDYTIDDPQLRFRLFVEDCDVPVAELISCSDMSFLQILNLPNPHKFELLEKRFFWILKHVPDLEDDTCAAEYYFGGFLFSASFSPPDMVECFLDCREEADKLLKAFALDDDLLDPKAPGDGRMREVVLDFLGKKGKHKLLREIRTDIESKPREAPLH